MNDYLKWLRFLLLAGILGCGIVAGAQDGNVVGRGEDARPEMSALFFTIEQRRILEAIRQEVSTEENIQIDELAPVVLPEETLSSDDVVITEEGKQRELDISVDAYLRNHKNGKIVLWLNGVQYRLDKQSEFLENEGIMSLSAGEHNLVRVYGVDKFNKSKFVLKVGQRLNMDGGVDESYPVVIIKKK